MTKMLNLDEVLPTIERVLTFKGKKHNLVPLSVGNFIDNVRLAKKLESNEDPADHIEAMMDMVSRVFPTLPLDDLRGLTFGQLNAILDFAKGTDEEVKEEVKGE